MTGEKRTGLRVEVDDFETLFDELDGGDEAAALDTILVQLVGVAANQCHVLSIKPDETRGTSL